ncbi:hypothetical protein K491DRAFT_257146 [Lophiostoma macrostomum CBS 122681]|uniref:Uncharacterized protein n=1 Tax=Lophiostoma macrostomum CBS 122681 TaxID=1314788 RepID=A0A6A6SJV7_9PLEO|nr:hypothetical protein K491DRAFT_257146 [Lophiostoma macrostomum CBS 122681]
MMAALGTPRRHKNLISIIRRPLVSAASNGFSWRDLIVIRSSYLMKTLHRRESAVISRPSMPRRMLIMKNQVSSRGGPMSVVLFPFFWVLTAFACRASYEDVGGKGRRMRTDSREVLGYRRPGTGVLGSRVDAMLDHRSTVWMSPFLVVTVCGTKACVYRGSFNVSRDYPRNSPFMAPDSQKTTYTLGLTRDMRKILQKNLTIESEKQSSGCNRWPKSSPGQGPNAHDGRQRGGKSGGVTSWRTA